MGTVESMDCERRAKPLKHTILTSQRNRMNDCCTSSWVREPPSHHECKEDAWKERLRVTCTS
eukprot:scaffold11633_cov63-Skeletonema_dohrnii-CCMP3373.AAC.1